MKNFILTLLIVVLTILLSPYIMYRIVCVALRKKLRSNRFKNHKKFEEFLRSTGIVPDEVKIVLLNKGSVGCPSEICARSNMIKINFDRLRFYNKKMLKSLLRHEMIHVRQFSSGRLTFTGGETAVVTWDGITQTMSEWYGMKILPAQSTYCGVIILMLNSMVMKKRYFFLPWEKEAYELKTLRGKMNVYRNVMLIPSIIFINFHLKYILMKIKNLRMKLKKKK